MTNVKIETKINFIKTFYLKFKFKILISRQFAKKIKKQIILGGMTIEETTKIKDEEVMVPTNDYVFKRIFGHVGNEEITKGLIGSIIKEKINTIKINENPITEKDMIYDKIGILDLKVRLNDKIICNIEMQVVQQEEIEKRIMFYWGKTYTGEIKKGDKYGVLLKTIVILIANFKLERLKEIERFHTKWQIREEKDRRIILTDTLEIHIIELPKLIKRLSKEKGDKIENEESYSMFIL